MKERFEEAFFCFLPSPLRLLLSFGSSGGCVLREVLLSAVIPLRRDGRFIDPQIDHVMSVPPAKCPRKVGTLVVGTTPKYGNVPEGQVIIAQQFTAGRQGHQAPRKVPPGTIERAAFSRP
jgi:hypothetical protein